MTYTALEKAARDRALDIFGAFHPNAEDMVPGGTGAVLLLGPQEPGFWATFTASPEYQDSAPDPLDRWSKRVIGALASDLNATAVFPSDGPPYPPFYRWAVRSGRAWASPVTLLVQDRAGLMVSYRAALMLPERIDLPSSDPAPCTTCNTKPCLTACPVGALTGDGYDLPACHAFLDTPKGSDCMTNGCAVRRACPVSQTYGRVPEQSAFHMKAFHSR
ncbi:ferredoxin [Aliiroseovarius sp. YM-037]|uniref:ferredoxin n=1 Tax=Aliiroseovarius sp. YM-037 TaxID=3341728 RepID=UPI003A803945